MKMMSCSRALTNQRMLKMFNMSITRTEHFSNSKYLTKSNKEKENLDHSTTSDSLQEKFRSFLEHLIVSVDYERQATAARERLLASNLPPDLLELRGLSICNLKIASDFFPPGTGTDFKIKLVRSEDELQHSLPSGGWRRGMLVSLHLEDIAERRTRSSPPEDWRKVDGVLEEVTSTGIIVSVDKVQGWVLDGLLGDRRSSLPAQSIKIVKRSEEKLYKNSLAQLRKLMRQNLSLPAKMIFEKTLGVGRSHNLGADHAGGRTDLLTVYNQQLLTDQSKVR